MLFASFDFLLLFAIAFAGYWALVRRPALRAAWVLAASYFFYMAGPKPVDGPLPTPWYFAGLLAASTLLDYVCGLFITAAQQRARSKGVSTRQPGIAKLWLFISLIANLGLLGYFKYTGFLFEVVSETAALFGADTELPTLNLLLPVGISFYTFQSLSYTIDVYRGQIQAERSFLRFALFIAFFPQLVAGPILRAGEFLPQLESRPRLRREDVDFAIWRISKGLIKKVVLADFIAASFTDRLFASPTEYSSLENLLALYAFTLQIYADFSGYSDIAIGSARLLGFRLPENFNRPYQAVDVADFWRRWHITLSTWLRDYVYYPLGGSKLGAAQTYVNLWVTMFLVGMWHGASWNFVIYAGLQASAMVYNRFCRTQAGSWFSQVLRLVFVSVALGVTATLFGSVVLELGDPVRFGVLAFALGLVIGVLPRADEWPALGPLHVLLTLHFSVLSRVFFRAESLDSARTMLGKLIAWDGLGVRDGLFANATLSAWLNNAVGFGWAEPLAQWFVLLLLVGGFVSHYVPARWLELTAERLIPRIPAVLVGVAFAVLVGGLSLLLAGPRSNIYFAF